MVAKRLKELGFSVTQEFKMPQRGTADILAHKNGWIYICECKSEKDRDMLKAMGQVLTYAIQLYEKGYKIKKGLIFTRTEPYRLRDDAKFLSKYLPFPVEVIRYSNQTPLLEI